MAWTSASVAAADGRNRSRAYDMRADAQIDRDD
jgi:hypothetical protein